MLTFWASTLVMSTTWPKENLLSSSVAWFRCRARTRWMVPLSSVVPPGVRSLLEDDATSPLLQGGCAERSEGRLAFDARLRGNPRLYGRFFGDLFAKGLITMGTAKARVAPFLVPKKDGQQRFLFDTREANHHFAPPPYTPLAGSQSLSSLQLPLGTALFEAQGDIGCCFYQLRLPHCLGQFFGSSTNCKKASAALATESLGPSIGCCC